jgi:hypothetical protein
VDGHSENEDEEQYRPINVPDAAVTKSIDGEARRLGDGTVHKYYFKSIGTANTLIFLIFQLIWLFMLKFPGKPIIGNFLVVYADLCL